LAPLDVVGVFSSTIGRIRVEEEVISMKWCACVLYSSKRPDMWDEVQAANGKEPFRVIIFKRWD